MEQAPELTWRIASSKSSDLHVSGGRSITQKELELHRVSISAILPAEFEGGELTVRIASRESTWQVKSYHQKGRFRLPLAGQVLIVSGHRIGEGHRSARIASEHFAWDLVPLHNEGLRMLNGQLSADLNAQDFAGFGQDVLAPANGRIVKAVDGYEDLIKVGELPTNLDYYLEDLNRAGGNCVVIEHGDDVWSFLAHFKKGSIQVKEGQDVSTSDKLGELGNSGFSSGPHIHFHFMDGPDFLTASALPVELDLEGGTYAPGAGEITSSDIQT